MTGFTRAEVMQRSSTTDFLHGPMTSQQAVNLIKDALVKGFEKHFEILYYRKNGKLTHSVQFNFNKTFFTIFITRVVIIKCYCTL